MSEMVELNQKEVSEKLDAILDRMDIVIHLLLSPIKRSEITLKGKMQKAVLELCDFGHTREDMAKRLDKSLNTIDVTLNSLRKQDFIKSVSVEGKTYYIRIK